MLLSIHKINFMWMNRCFSEEEESWGEQEREKRGHRKRVYLCMTTRWEGECLCVRRRAGMYQEKRSDQRCKEMTHWVNMIQQKNQNRVIISQAVLQRSALILAPISAAAVLLSIWTANRHKKRWAVFCIMYNSKTSTEWFTVIVLNYQNNEECATPTWNLN